MKYLSRIEFCGKFYFVKAIDVLSLEHRPRELIYKIANKKVSDYEAEILWTQLEEIKRVSEEELEIIESVCSSVVKKIKVEVKNSELAKYTFGIASVMVNAINEYGLLKTDWYNLTFWEFLICSKLQEIAVKEFNKKYKK